mgnify:CR=1 FL=1
MTELIASPADIKEISFDVVTGGVLFGTHDEDNIIVKVYRSAREEDGLEDIDANVNLDKNGVVSITSFSPAFEFSSCQFSYVEVLFPSDLTKQINPVKVTGQVNAGFVELGFLSNLGEVQLNVDLGGIEIDGVNADSIEVQNGLGYIDAKAIFALKHAKFAVQTGSVRTHYITTPEFEALTEYGTSWNIETYTDKATVHTEYGYATMLRPTHFTVNQDQSVSVSTLYGKSLVSYDLMYDVEFNVDGEYGEHIVVYDNECELDEEQEEEDPAALIGTCPFETFEPVTQVKVFTTYGHSSFLQNEPDTEDLQYYPESDDIILN